MAWGGVSARHIETRLPAGGTTPQLSPSANAVTAAAAILTAAPSLAPVAATSTAASATVTAAGVPAAYPSILQVSGRSLVDANGYTMPSMKGFNVQAGSGPSPNWTAATFTAMASEGASIVRTIVFWDQLEPTSGSIDANAIAALDAHIANLQSAGLYTILCLYYGPASHTPSWVNSHGSLWACTNGQYITSGQNVTQYLANRYGNSSSGQYTKAVIGFGINEPAPDSTTNSIPTLESQQSTMIGWCRTYAPNWIGFVSYGYSAATPIYNGALGQDTSSTNANPHAYDSVGGNVVIDLHDYMLGCTTTSTADDGRQFNGMKYPTYQAGGQEIEIDYSVSPYTSRTLPPVYATSVKYRSQQAAYVAPYKSFCATNSLPLMIGEWGWPTSTANPPAQGSGQQDYLADKVAIWNDAGAIISIQWDYNVTQSQDEWGAKPTSGSTPTWQTATNAWMAQPAAFPTVSALDNFDRTAENPLSDAGAWNAGGIEGTAVLKTNGTQALSSVATGTFAGQAWNTSFAQPVEMYVDLPAVQGTAGDQIVLAWLASPTSFSTNGYKLIFTTTTWTIYRDDSGTLTSRASGSLTVAAGDSIGLTIKGSVLTAWWKPSGSGWRILGTATDPTYTGSGYCGLETNDASVLFDNFGAGTSASNTTALAAYLTATNDTLLTTARQLTSSAPSSESSIAATGQLAKNGTGWIELPSKGGSSTTLAGSEPAVSGNGFIWDVTTLESQQIVAGNWTPIIKLSCPGGSFVAEIHVRIFKRSSGGTYTQFTSGGVATDLVQTGVTISTAAATTFTAASLDAMSFVTGDKLYVDVVLNITTGNSNNTAANRVISLYENGGANDVIVTPGYAAAGATPQPISPVAGAAAVAVMSLTAASALVLTSGAATVASVTITAPVAIVPAASAVTSAVAQLTAAAALAPTAAALTAAIEALTAPTMLTAVAQAAAAAATTLTAPSGLTPVGAVATAAVTALTVPQSLLPAASGVSAAAASVTVSQAQALTPTAVAATAATTAMTAAAVLVPQAAAVSSAVAPATAPTKLVPVASTATSATAFATAMALLSPQASSVTAAATLVSVQQPLTPVAVSVTVVQVPVTAATVVTPQAAATSSATVPVTALTKLVLTAASASAATAPFTAASVIVPAASATTTAVAPVTIPQPLTATAANASAAALLLSAPTFVTPLAVAVSAGLAPVTAAASIVPLAAATSAGSGSVTAAAQLLPAATNSTAAITTASAKTLLSPAAFAITGASAPTTAAAIIIPTAASTAGASVPITAGGVAIAPTAATVASGAVALSASTALALTAAASTAAASPISAAATLTPIAVVVAAGTAAVSAPTAIAPQAAARSAATVAASAATILVPTAQVVSFAAVPVTVTTAQLTPTAAAASAASVPMTAFAALVPTASSSTSAAAVTTTGASLAPAAVVATTATVPVGAPAAIAPRAGAAAGAFTVVAWGVPLNIVAGTLTAGTATVRAFVVSLYPDVLLVGPTGGTDWSGGLARPEPVRFITRITMVSGNTFDVAHSAVEVQRKIMGYGTAPTVPHWVAFDVPHLPVGITLNVGNVATFVQTYTAPTP